METKARFSYHAPGNFAWGKGVGISGVVTAGGMIPGCWGETTGPGMDSPGPSSSGSTFEHPQVKRVRSRTRIITHTG
jgi:hypothetical protein